MRQKKIEKPMQDPCKSCGIMFCNPDDNESCVPRRSFLKEQEQLRRQNQ